MAPFRCVNAAMAGIERTISVPSSSGASAAPSGAALPELEGYDIIDQVGRGGMGVVYEAFQQATGRRVAVKLLLNEAQSSDAARQRFEREVELAARLQHPAIVSILDSGIHRGRYFYVMEYVDGRPLDQWILDFGLSILDSKGTKSGQSKIQNLKSKIDAVLRLMAHICDAVDYAHQRGVLHRDLKPSNILVASVGAVSDRDSPVTDRDSHASLARPSRSETAPTMQPKILDFGLAKAIDPAALAPAEITLSEPGQLLGTLAYMSPEQSRGAVQELSVRSDVYSLGAIAYQLLTGALPCDVTGAMGDVLARLASRDPVRPSTLRKGLGADIDAILLKALEKTPARRYATAGEMAADIHRYLGHQTILARRARLGARFWRLLQRNRTMSAVVAAASVTIIGVLAYSFVSITRERDIAKGQRDVATRERDRAWAEARRKGESLNVIQKLLDAVDPNVAGRPNFTVRDMLDYMAADVDSGHRRDPEVQASIQEMLGRTYFKLGDWTRAAMHLEAARNILEHMPEPPREDLARTLLYLAGARLQFEGADAVEPLYRESLKLREQLGPDDGEEVALSRQGMGYCLTEAGRLAEAEHYFLKALSVQQARLGDDDPQTALTHNSYARLLWKLGCREEALAQYSQAVAGMRRVHGGGSWEEATSLMHLAEDLLHESGPDRLPSAAAVQEARTALCRALQIRRQLFGNEDPLVGQTLEQFNRLLKREPPLDLAEANWECAHAPTDPVP